MSYREIAHLAQVERPVVTTWRRRYPDFPAPTQTLASQPLFPAAAVVEWLLRSGLGNLEPTALRAELTLHTLAAYAQEHGGRRLVLSLGAALCLRHMADAPLPADPMRLAARLDFDGAFLLPDLEEAPALADLSGMVEQLIEGAYDTDQAHRFLLDAAARLGWPGLGTEALTPHLVNLIRLAADMPGRLAARSPITVADPYAGSGDLIAALLTGIDPEQAVCCAVQPDPALARLIRRRLHLAGIPEFHLDVGPVLADDFADADVIVTRLPYQPAETRNPAADLDRISDLTDLLGPGRTAVVIGPAASLVDALRDHQAIRRRAELLTGGLVEAVVRLPGGVFPARPGHPAAMWVLTRDPVPTTKGRLLVADLSGAALDEHRTESAAEDILLWRTEGHRRDSHAPRTGEIVLVRDLDLPRGAPLQPAGPATVTLLTRPAADGPALIGEVERRLADAEQAQREFTEKHRPLNTTAAHRDADPPKRVSLGTLSATRRARHLPGHRLAPQHVGPRGQHRVLGAAEVTTGTSNRFVDRFVLAGEYQHAALTEPGDLVISTVPGFAALVDQDGFSVIEFPAQGLRLSPGDALTPRVLKALLDTAHNTTRNPGAVRGPRLRDVTIPDLSRREATRLDELLRRLDERERLLQQQTDLLAELRGLAVTGFADGTLTTLYGTNS